jgi:hypothetical protein
METFHWTGRETRADHVMRNAAFWKVAEQAS